MARKLQSDRWLFMATFALICVSVVMVYSASALVAFERYQQPYLFVTKQVLWAGLGIALLSLIMRVDYRTYRNETFVWTLLAVVAVLLVAVLFSRPINGTRRWFGIGGFGIQPSELAKLAVVLFTALILERRMHRVNEVSYALLPIGIVVGVACGLIMVQPDFGTALSLVAIAGVMVFAAGLSYRYLVGTALVIAPLLYIVVMSAGYRRRRLFAFLDPWADPLGDGFQIIQSLIAVGTGGVLGRGLMQGVQKLFYLPEPHTDFIYAVISEEFGLLGATLIARLLRHHRLARAAHRHAGARRVRRLPGARPHDDDGRAGVREHERRSRPAADQGHHAAAGERRGLVAAHQPAGHRRVAEHLAARPRRIGSDVSGAYPDRGRRNRGASLPRHRGRARAAARDPACEVTFVGTPPASRRVSCRARASRWT
jgi:cell division protein FtsW